MKDISRFMSVTLRTDEEAHWWEELLGNPEDLKLRKPILTLQYLGQLCTQKKHKCRGAEAGV